MKSRLSSALLPLIALLALPAGNLFAHDAEGTLEKIERTGEFLIGYRIDSSPLSYENSTGEPSGYSVDICKRIAASINAYFPDQDIETKFVSLKSEERLSAVVEGKVDIECGSTTITLSRHEQVDFSLPTFVTGGNALTLAASGIQLMSDLSGKRVGVVEGTTTAEELKVYLEDNLIDAEIVLVSDRTEGMQYLNRGGVDALASDQIVLIGQVIESADPSRYALVNEIFSFEPYGLVLRRDDADFRLQVNSAIAQLYRNGEEADIFYRWIGRIGIGVPPVVAAMYQLNALSE